MLTIHMVNRVIIYNVHNVQDLCRDQGGLVCEGRGECVCGECQCEASDKGTISGKFCQCLDWTCPQVTADHQAM